MVDQPPYKRVNNCMGQSQITPGQVLSLVTGTHPQGDLWHAVSLVWTWGVTQEQWLLHGFITARGLWGIVFRREIWDRGRGAKMNVEPMRL